MPRPLYSHSSTAFQSQISNAGLWYDKFCDRWGGDWSFPDGGKAEWIRTITNEKQIGDRALISEFIRRQKTMINSLGGIYLPFRTESRFVTGLGTEHPVENGFAWHPILGVPYLPGSSIKGMLRAWAVANDQRDLADKIFGFEERPDGVAGSVGCVLLFDAIPTGPVRLEMEVMTPHYSAYYESGDTPGDWLSPVPIPFLIVPSGVDFLFAIAPRTANAKEHLDTVSEWLRDALKWIGAGAKTAVGYGRFETGKSGIERSVVKDVTAKIQRYKVGDVVLVTRVEDPKPKAGKTRIWFVADDGFGGVVTGGTPPDIQIGATVRLEIAAVTRPGGYNFRIPKQG